MSSSFKSHPLVVKVDPGDSFDHITGLKLDRDYGNLSTVNTYCDWLVRWGAGFEVRLCDLGYLLVKSDVLHRPRSKKNPDEKPKRKRGIVRRTT